MGLYANLRPVRVLPSLIDASPIKPERLAGVDFLVVRELTGGVYFGRPRRRWQERRGRAALDTMIYREHEVRRIVELAFDLAERRGGRVASVDKANVLDTSRLWRSVVQEIAAARPSVAVEHVLVDSMAMRLITGPASLDVVVTENMFGDILTDEASVLAGSIGVLPSASIGAARDDGSGRRRGVFEPIHGSAPDIAGQGKANPIGTILSLALMLRIALGEDDAATAVERAVEATLEAGVRTGRRRGGRADGDDDGHGRGCRRAYGWVVDSLELAQPLHTSTRIVSAPAPSTRQVWGC
jgi:3-isopropylmalate dehydrogenase